MRHYLEFEKPVAQIEGKIHELRSVNEPGDNVDLSGEIKKLEAKADTTLAGLYQKLSPWDKTQVARHPDRPHFIDYQQNLFSDFVALSGDRHFADDHAIQAGFARFDDKPILLLGQEKGADTQTRLTHNFGMARPEGYRKAIRLMDMAERFQLPIIALVDTAGAYPGIGAEERGQAEAIAKSIENAFLSQCR